MAAPFPMLPLLILATVSSVVVAPQAPIQEIWYSVDATPVHSQLFVADGDGKAPRALLPETGLDYDPSLSADGQWVVFTSERHGSADLFRVRTNGSGLERLTDDPAFDDQGALSPDGRTLAFVSTRKSGRPYVWLLDLKTRKSRRLTDQPGSFHPAWSPDGRWLAFSSDGGQPSGHRPGRWEKLQSLSVYIMRADGTGLRRITRGRGVAGSPRWSPDGNRVIYYETDEMGAMWASSNDAARGTTHLCGFDVAEGTVTQLTVGDEVRRNPQPLADGSVAFLATDSKGVIGLANVKDHIETKGTTGDFRSPSWSSDGKRVVYAQPTFADHVELLPAFTREPGFRLRQLANGAAFPTPSPAGKSVLISTFQALLSCGPDGSVQKTLLSAVGTQELLLSPAWSPDGRQIAFARGSYFRPGNHPTGQIGVMDADGSNIKMSGVPGTNSGFPSWSPDGKSIVYAQDAHLVTWNLADGKRRNLTQPGGQRDNFPEWSPRGDWIAFTSDRDADENFKIFMIRPDGTGLHRVTRDSGDSHAVWSPDGEWLLFSSARMGFKDEMAYSESPQPYGELFLVRRDGTGLRQLTDDKWESGSAAFIR